MFADRENHHMNPVQTPASRYPVGAEWRRWDLHVHTPESMLENRFGSWDDYVAALEAAPSTIAVVGVTDYCSIDGYKKLLEYRAAGRLKNFALLIPNIEFRMTPELPGGGAINVHVLVSPHQNDHVAEIDRALRDLKFSYNGNPYACTRDDLIRLGKAHDPKQTDEYGAYRNGMNNFKPSFEVVRDWIEKNRWLQDNSLIVLANGKDGAGGLSRDAGMSAMRDELYRFADLIFSGNPADRTYFLGLSVDKADEVIRKCGSLKPCVHGSDAHDDNSLFQPTHNRYCWIKADPTFEGLRQLLHEPADRVHIGETPPVPHDQSKIIKSILIEGAPDWFAQDTIELNSGLVTIIGEKGSGKTALADLIALSTGAYDGEERSSSFLGKASELLEDLNVTTTWGDGSTTAKSLSDDALDEQPRVRYLSQDFVEDLCSQDHSGSRLIEEIEHVVFSHIDPSERLGASSFSDLRRLSVEHLTEEREAARARLIKLNAEIVRLEDEIASKPTKQALIKKCADEIAALDKQLPELENAADAAVAAKLAAERERSKLLMAEVTEINRKLNRLQAAATKFKQFVAATQREFSALAEVLEELGLTATEIGLFEPKFPVGADAVLLRQETTLKTELETKRGNAAAPNPTGNSVADTNFRIASLEKDLATDEEKRQRLLALQKQRVKLAADKSRAEAEITKIDTLTTKSLADKKAQRRQEYSSFFETLGDEASLLRELYSPLKQVVAEDTSGTKSGFELEVRQRVDYASWLESGRDFFDMRKKRDLPPFDPTEFHKTKHRALIEAWKRADPEAICTSVETYASELGGDAQSLNAKLLPHASRLKVYDWLYSTEHVEIDYGLTYQGTSLEALSPGARGIVLLVLYLAMDQSDTRPLIIDQPEGNLDNASVYEALVPFLITAKRTRQIILVTHNPNLVITTDAEQVIVATADRSVGSSHPKIAYSSGAIEDTDTSTSIRSLVVRLLEGGRRPFKVRELRYALRQE